jgi:aminopeptidase N
MISRLLTLVTIFVSCQMYAQVNTDHSPMRQLYDLLPTPNSYRTASGAPGPDYFQPRADYDIKVELDDDKQRIYGEETITFHNTTPEDMNFLWVQLDQNISSKESDSHKINSQAVSEKPDPSDLTKFEPWFDGGFKLDYVKDASTNKDLKYIVNKTMMRVDMPSVLKRGGKYSFKVKYWYNINDRMKLGGRSGYEYFEEDKNYLYTIAQFFPRMCAYNDIEGWQTNQYLGSGEFTLIFGNYNVSITVPADHLVAATGTLQNMDKVLTKEQMDRYRKATTSFNQPIIIATQAEAIEREKIKSTQKKTWIFKADNVRDFAFATSRKFIWDAMNTKLDKGTTMSMSMYPKEGNPLWEKYSTKAVAHTIKTYTKFSCDYPYPVAWSINADRIGMEYPMICFNFGRCEKDGTYAERTKYGMISVIIHEVGHNFFPMIINSDERQWGWMDEGLNSFVQFLAEQEFERNYPSGRGEASKIVDYMKGEKSKQSPIMMNPDAVFQLGYNAYTKPAIGLNILRETIMGRELFDAAFKEYSTRWAFKQPYPADFFRTMEDASGMDLDWFWRGWFFTNDHVDLAISDVRIKSNTEADPAKRNQDAEAKAKIEQENSLTYQRNMKDIKKTYNEVDTTLNDFYTSYNRFATSEEEKAEFEKKKASLSDDEKKAMDTAMKYYEIEFESKGGLVMPVLYDIHYADGTVEEIRIPAEIWRKGEKKVTRVHATQKEITKIILDPHLETADIDTSNNSYPPEEEITKFEAFKRSNRQGLPQQNPMQKAAAKSAKP